MPRSVCLLRVSAGGLCFFINFWRTSILFVGQLIPLFWTSGEVCAGFQSLGGSLVCVVACVPPADKRGQHGSWAFLSMYLKTCPQALVEGWNIRAVSTEEVSMGAGGGGGAQGWEEGKMLGCKGTRGRRAQELAPLHPISPVSPRALRAEPTCWNFTWYSYICWMQAGLGVLINDPCIFLYIWIKYGDYESCMYWNLYISFIDIATTP